VLLAESINAVRKGRLDPRVSNAVGYLAGVLQRALEQGPTEERLARLETILGLAGNSQKGKPPVEVTTEYVTNLLTRIERVEKAAAAQSIFSPDCICFAKNEPPFFCFLIEEQFAAKVKCPLHCERFKPITFRIYVGKWRRIGLDVSRKSH